MNNTISANDLVDWVKENHYNPNDLIEGDLIDRIFNYENYQLQTINIEELDVEEWETCDDQIKEYQTFFQKTNNCPPIIYDIYNNSIIDGSHRAKALKLLGLKTIQAYIGS